MRRQLGLIAVVAATVSCEQSSPSRLPNQTGRDLLQDGDICMIWLSSHETVKGPDGRLQYLILTPSSFAFYDNPGHPHPGWIGGPMSPQRWRE
ncbi:MAG: hypothetical protein ACYTFI_23310, partial [Planctomycetota bacterium]